MRNAIQYVHFSDSEKIEAFDKIAEMFYYANFGQASKTEIELLMFDIYLRKMIKENINPADNTIDYVYCSDYNISKELGITQQRVRGLKVKKQLVYPEEFDWKVSLVGLMRHARLENTKIIINIPDPNLYYEIQNFIEERGGYIETQLNSKVLQIRQEYFLLLAIEVEDEDNQKKILKRIKKELHSHDSENKALEKKQIAQSIISGAVDITAIVANISSLFTVGAPLIEGFKLLLGT